jgi:hypothetical protein
MTAKAKPKWVKDQWGPSYTEIVDSWGYEVLAMDIHGSYQGDYTVLLADGERRGFTVIGYGSCSGCDALESRAPWGDEEGADWSGVVDLADSLRDGVVWRESATELADYLVEELASENPNNWYSFDDEVTRAFRGYVTQLRGVAV